MKTVTYAQIASLAAREAGRPPGKLPTSEAELLRDFIGDHLPEVWNREAWPELCNDFEIVTLANGQFAKSDSTKGDVLSIYVGGNPQVNTICQPVEDWVETDGAVRVNPGASGAVFVEYQDPVATLPEYGAAGLDATTLPERFKYPLARLAAADLIEEEDPGKAERLRNRAERELQRQASRFSVPWWRRPRLNS
jgi:hypothetical protein